MKSKAGASWVWGFPAGAGYKQVGICFDDKNDVEIVFTVTTDQLAQLRELVFGEADRMRPVVEAAKAWRQSTFHDESLSDDDRTAVRVLRAHKDAMVNLQAVVDAYMAVISDKDHP